MARVPEAFLEISTPTCLDEFEVTLLGGAVDLVTHHRMTRVGKVNPDLMGASGMWSAMDQRQRTVPGMCYPMKNTEGSMRGSPLGMNRSLEPDPGMLDLAEPQDRLADIPLLLFRPPGDQCEVFLGDLSPGHCHRTETGG